MQQQLRFNAIHLRRIDQQLQQMFQQHLFKHVGLVCMLMALVQSEHVADHRL